ncbi:MAG: hypothetical protein JNG86_11245, partial [Verrucomicrobiaceae bacterium]|nr:hypothetical protein [Verrucomicrobiaceae bacterium]
MKWITSFRAKLIFTVFPVVAAVTIVALWMAERRFSDTYRRLFEEQFEAQIEALTAAKPKRFESLSTRLEAQAARPEVIAAMQKKDLKELWRVLRPELEILAAERMQNESPMTRRGEEGRPGGMGVPPQGAFRRLDEKDKNRPGPGGAGPGGLPLPIRRDHFIALVDAKGVIYTTAQLQRGAAEGELVEMRRKGGGMKEWLGNRRLEDVLKQQEVSYLHLELPGEGGASIELVREVFLTPLRDPKDGKFIGAFAFGLPLATFTETLLANQTKKSEFGEIMSGTWVEDQLVTTTIPPDKREELSVILRQSLD